MNGGGQPRGSDSDDLFARNDRRRRSHFGRRASRRERSREQALRDWYGDEAGVLEAARRRRLRSAADVVDDVMAAAGVREAGVLERLQQDWPAIVGSDIARQSMPVALRDGWLTVEVADSTWRYILISERRADIMDRLRASAAGASLRQVRFVPPGRRPPTP